MHRESGQHIARKGIDVLVGVRGLAEKMVDTAKQNGMRAEFLGNADAAGEWLARETRDGDVVLLKASRGVKLEKALEKLSAIGPQGSAELKPTTDVRRSTNKH
jgi:UDP-N-acetylmuramoyl-tripeptide--D-alanyl-D-alanine ligase